MKVWLIKGSIYTNKNVKRVLKGFNRIFCPCSRTQCIVCICSTVKINSSIEQCYLLY